jgi:hypothetical protein
MPTMNPIIKNKEFAVPSTRYLLVCPHVIKMIPHVLIHGCIKAAKANILKISEDLIHFSPRKNNMMGSDRIADIATSGIDTNANILRYFL